jgi:hypothetical protein
MVSVAVVGPLITGLIPTHLPFGHPAVRPLTVAAGSSAPAVRSIVARPF